MHWESADLPSHRSRLTQEEIDELIKNSPIPLRQFDSDGVQIDWETWRQDPEIDLAVRRRLGEI